VNSEVLPPGPGADAPELLAADGAGVGPAAIVRELARDLLFQGRLTRADAVRLQSALRDHDWPNVRITVHRALARHPQILPPHAVDPAAAPEREVAVVLVRLVLRLCEALPKIAASDPALEAKVDSIRSLLTEGLTPERLHGVDARVTELIDQQVRMQRNLQEARSSLKDMLTLVVGRLGIVDSSTTRFQERVDVYRGELDGQTDAAAVRAIVGRLLADTQEVSEAIRQSQEELAQARHRVESYEMRVRNLEQELAQTARMIQNDPLTHALNRRGLDAVFRVEAARAARYRVPLTVVMIDLDDFKGLNDSLGHAAGDQALVHFVTTTQACLRTTEFIARTGGEEFAILFPATGITAAVDAIRRLQRELARSQFPNDGQGRVMTFSGGAAAWHPGESLAQVLQRADAAMYQAKRSGKNLVVIAPDAPETAAAAAGAAAIDSVPAAPGPDECAPPGASPPDCA